MQKRTISVMGDGGFWHNGLLSGVASSMFNRGDRVLVIMQNGYTSATGAQFIPNTSGNRRDGETTSDIAATLKAMGVGWLRTIRTYNVGTMLNDPARGDEHRRQGPQGHRGRRRMPARAPAPHPPADRRATEARRAGRAHALRRRRRGLHRRPFLHPPVRLPVAGGEAQPRPAAHRSGGAASTTAASAAACAARWPMPPCSARPSTRPTSSRTRPGGIASEAGGIRSKVIGAMAASCSPRAPPSSGGPKARSPS